MLEPFHRAVWNREQPTVCEYLLLELHLAFSDHSWLQIAETPNARPQIRVGGVFPPPSHTPLLKNKICFGTRVISTHSVNTLCHKCTKLLTIRSTDGFWVQNIYKSHFSGIWPKRRKQHRRGGWLFSQHGPLPTIGAHIKRRPRAGPPQRQTLYWSSRRGKKLLEGWKSMKKQKRGGCAYRDRVH